MLILFLNNYFICSQKYLQTGQQDGQRCSCMDLSVIYLNALVYTQWVFLKNLVKDETSHSPVIAISLTWLGVASRYLFASRIIYYFIILRGFFLLSPSIPLS